MRLLKNDEFENHVSNFGMIGFDLDHALARYKTGPSFKTIYASIVRSLVLHFGAPAAAFFVGRQCNKLHHDSSTHVHCHAFQTTRKGDLLHPSSGLDDPVPPEHVTLRFRAVFGDHSEAEYADEDYWASGWCEDFVHKGLVFHLAQGNLIKLNSLGQVVSAVHGSHVLSQEEIARIYSAEVFDIRTLEELKGKYEQIGIWEGFDTLKKQEKHPDILSMTYFDLPFQLVVAQWVDWLDKLEFLKALHCEECVSSGNLQEPENFHSIWQNHRSYMASGTNEETNCISCNSSSKKYTPSPLPERYLIVPEILYKGVDYIFHNVEGFHTGRGGYFSMLRAFPERYYYKRPELAMWLREQRRKSAIKVVLVTNSHIDFARMTLHYIFGEDWRSCFDMVVYYGNKPLFFSTQQRWKSVCKDSIVPEDTDKVSIPFTAVSNTSKSVAINPDSSATGVAKDVDPLASKKCLEYFNGNANVLQCLLDTIKTIRDGSILFEIDNALLESATHISAYLDEMGHIVSVRLERYPPNFSQHMNYSDVEPIESQSLPLPQSFIEYQLKLATRDSADHRLRRLSISSTGSNNSATSPPHSPRQSGTRSRKSSITLGLTDEWEIEADVADMSEISGHLATIITPPNNEPNVATANRNVALSTVMRNSDCAHYSALKKHPSTHPLRKKSPHVKVLYVGDHLHGDMVASSNCGWYSVCILEELQFLEDKTVAFPSQTPSPRSYDASTPPHSEDGVGNSSESIIEQDDYQNDSIFTNAKGCTSMTKRRNPLSFSCILSQHGNRSMTTSARPGVSISIPHVVHTCAAVSTLSPTSLRKGTASYDDSGKKGPLFELGTIASSEIFSHRCSSISPVNYDNCVVGPSAISPIWGNFFSPAYTPSRKQSSAANYGSNLPSRDCSDISSPIEDTNNIPISCEGKMFNATDILMEYNRLVRLQPNYFSHLVETFATISISDATYLIDCLL